MVDVVYYLDDETGNNDYKLIGSEFAVAVYLATGGDKSKVFYDEAGFPYDVRHFADGRVELI